MDWEPQRPSAPSTPTSISSQSTGTSSSRLTLYKPITPSPSVTALSKLTNDDLRRKGIEDLIRILRRIEGDYKAVMGEHTGIVKDINRRMQIHLLEIRGLKDINQKLQDDNQELRDLCCFLDDDRQRGRKLAREWQRFGRYTASVMRSEVAAYQEKLRELEQKQEELISDNLELKELCLYLDQERIQFTSDRDEGDGSSNGTVTGQEDGHLHNETNGQSHHIHIPRPHSNIPAQTANYIRHLEDKVRQLEEEKKQLAQRVERNGAEGYRPSDRQPFTATQPHSGVRAEAMQPTSNSAYRRSAPMGHIAGSASHSTVNPPTPGVNKPEAVVHAMKVLQVHEQLERAQRDVGEENLDDKEKAIVREMCNVVWRKLGDVGPEKNNRHNSQSATPIPLRQVYPPPPAPGGLQNPPPPAPSYHSPPPAPAYQLSTSTIGYQPPPPAPSYQTSAPTSGHHPPVTSSGHHPSTSSLGSVGLHPSASSGYRTSASSGHNPSASSGHQASVSSGFHQPASNGNHSTGTSSLHTTSSSHYPLASSGHHSATSSAHRLGTSNSHQSVSSGGHPPTAASASYHPPTTSGIFHPQTSSSSYHHPSTSSSCHPSHSASGYHPPHLTSSSHHSSASSGNHHSPSLSPGQSHEQPPPPAPRQPQFYHQEWRQTYLDGGGGGGQR